ncbi:aminotransferase [Streptomyces tateyamensis]|uniref:Aminotransferase n=1 Tax=Streptomyces tateyamensis TaxID=565073 RepID=A0A2V4NAZ5_9ACTN|nr:aminotransferase class V-fold PLP-dependent enzyme [Streptomyces tateyamensis]PYC77211.1 aminotransferase [Streptomyces tateyamensis]
MDLPDPIPGAAELFALDPAVAHLNHGSYGAVPDEVRQAQAALRAEQEADPDGFFLQLPGRIAQTRAAIAPLLGADPAGLALLSNVTEAVAVALDSIPFGPGEEILVTDHGYGVVNRAVERRAAECGATMRTVPVALDAVDPGAAVLAALGPSTRAVVLDRITSPTAREFATRELVAALAARGVITLVDAAHAPGMLDSHLDSQLDQEVGGPDFWFGNLHKWAFAPRPTAVLAVAPKWRARVRPLTYSWEHEGGYPGNVEWRGTADYTGWLAAPAGLALLARLGVSRVREHNERLAAYGQALLVERAGLVALPASPGVSMRAVRLPAGTAEREEQVRPLMAAVLEQLGTRIAVRPWAGGGVLRISAQVYNRPAEYERLAEGLRGVLGS